MDIDIFPQVRLQNNGNTSDLGIRITLHVTGRTKEEKKGLRDLWEKIEDTKDIETLVNVIKDFDAKSNIKE